MIVYIAGPMRGHKLYNFPAFDAARDRLMAAGHDVLSPADLDRGARFDPADMPDDTNWDNTPPGFDVRKAAVRDIDAIKACDAVYMLRGWRTSRLAPTEKALAEWLGKDVMYEDTADTEAGPPPALPSDSAERKTYPLYRGLFLYFPRALCAVAHHSCINNEKHNPGEPVHWDRSKSTDHVDAQLRHIVDQEWVANAWRALAQCETWLEQCTQTPQ